MPSRVPARHFIPTAARRGAALLAIIGLAGCDAGRTVDVAPTVTSDAVAAFAATGSGTSAPSVVSVPLANASFESGYTGWSFPGSPGQYVDIGNLWQASNGSGSVDLNGFNPGFVAQSFLTIPGVTYTVNFDLAGNPGNPQGTKTLKVSAAAASAPYSFSTVGKSGSNMGWTAQTFVFTATGTTSTLTFQSTYVGNGFFPDAAQGPALDNVRVTWVPTPTTTTVTFGSGPFVYTGSAFTATASVDQGGGTPVITYAGDCVNAGGVCKATATTPANGQYAASTAMADITIEQAPTATTVSFGSGPFVYNGSAFTATASVSPAAAGTATITYSGDCTNAGSSCTATASFAGSGNYAASSSDPVSITIDKAPTTTSVSFGVGPTVYYTGSAFTATASVSPAAAGSATIAYSGQCTLAGVCSATATYAGNSNYLPSSASTSITIKYPVATTGDQCKKGGWQFLTDDLGNLFKNQGDCVSYVATKGRNKGAGGA